MTHTDIYEKFLIEYDKANVTSSYPLLTKYEIATILDKAYYALIAQKYTGNNVRRVQFEGDLKAVADLQGLIKVLEITVNKKSVPSNMYSGKLPGDFLYWVSAHIDSVPVKLVSHGMAEKFYKNIHNDPWIKNPVCFIELNNSSTDTNGTLNILKDSSELSAATNEVHLQFIQKPKTFLDLAGKGPNGGSFGYGILFECGDSMAEELVSLAITFALENVESPRLNTKLNTRGLEA